jgi:hypothetical protein
MKNDNHEENIETNFMFIDIYFRVLKLTERIVLNY